MMWWYDGGLGWFGWLITMLVMLAFWAVLIFGGIALYGSLRRGRTRQLDHENDAERLLDERFARGEIDAEEYRERRELLRTRP